MRQTVWVRGMAAAAALLLLVGMAGAGDGAPGPATKITLKGMHCAGCAMKVAGQLKQIPGVSDAQVDAKTGVAIVTPASERPLSPRALWEAIELAGKKPIRIDGPSGTFTSKPKS